jgi:hypothetical protein
MAAVSSARTSRAATIWRDTLQPRRQGPEAFERPSAPEARRMPAALSAPDHDHGGGAASGAAAAGVR